MCWSGEASAVLAAVGVGTAVYSAAKKMHPALWVTLGYFSLMELLQAFTYQVIDRCALPSNQIATLLGYLHIAFQPFFINLISMYFLPQAWQQKIRIPVYIVCFIAAIIMIFQMLPFEWAGVCRIGEPMCAAKLCSVHGNWHIAWDVPLNGLGFMAGQLHVPLYLAAYGLAGFVMPVLYGVWRGTIFHLMLGPLLAYFTTNNPNEWPAVWCLFSIGIIMLVIKVRTSAWLSNKLIRTRG